MRVFLYEHITGGGCVDAPLPEALLPEAQLMLGSLASDLSEAACRVVALCDHRIDVGPQSIECHVIDQRDQLPARFDQLVASSDAVWLIAPETDGVLERLSQRVVLAGQRLLGSHPQAIRVAASKYATARLLRSAGVSVIPTFRFDERIDLAEQTWIAKPDDGCGCEDTRIFADLGRARAWVEARTAPQRFLVQPYVYGEPASLSVLAANGRAWLLSVNLQRIEVRDGGFSFLGSVANAMPDPAGVFQRLAQSIAEAIPGLWGYFGVDLILAESGPMVLEVNPRLTTSYAGLRAALDINPAALVLSLLDDAFCMPSLNSVRAIAVDLPAHPRSAQTRGTDRSASRMAGG